MKKFLAIAVIAATFTACNDDKKTDVVATDSTAITTAVTDTTHAVVVDTTHAVVVDTASKMAPKMEVKKMETKTTEVKKP